MSYLLQYINVLFLVIYENSGLASVSSRNLLLALYLGISNCVFHQLMSAGDRMRSWMCLVQVWKELEELGLPYTKNSLHRYVFFWAVVSS